MTPKVISRPHVPDGGESLLWKCLQSRKNSSEGVIVEGGAAEVTEAVTQAVIS